MTNFLIQFIKKKFKKRDNNRTDKYVTSWSDCSQRKPHDRDLHLSEI